MKAQVNPAIGNASSGRRGHGDLPRLLALCHRLVRDKDLSITARGRERASPNLSARASSIAILSTPSAGSPSATLLRSLSAVPLGLLFGWYPAINQVVNPVVQILRPISPIAWIPVAIIFFGVGDYAAIFLVFLGAFFPIVVTCVDSVANVPLIYRRAGTNFGLTPPQLLARVVFPAALPQILVGLRIALGIAWLVVVAGEMIAVNSGLGYLIIDSRNSGKRYDLVVGAMLLIGVIGLMLDLLFRRIETMKPVRWGFRNES